MNVLENHGEAMATPSKHRQDIKLHELEQQLEMAETRCGTLKQQLDYMRNLYHDSHMECPSEKKSNKEHSKRKGKNKNKPRNLNTEFPLENKQLQLSSACSNKNSPRQQMKKDVFTLKANNCISEMTNCDTIGPCGECPGSVTYEFPIKEVNLQNRPLSADSRPLSSHSKPVNMYSRPSSTHGIHPVTQNSLEIPSTHIEADEMSLETENKLESTSSAVQVIQDILCGITKSVNRISELNDFINEGGRECYSQSYRGEDTSNIFYNNQDGEDIEPQIRELRDEDDDEDQHSNASNKQFDLNIDNTEQLYESIQKGRRQSRKGKRSRAGKRDIPPKLLSNHRTTESIESLHGSKRKAKAHGKNTDRKLKTIGSPHLHTTRRTKLNDDIISVTTKIRKKRTPKLQHCSSKSASVGQCSSDYHEISNRTNHNVNKDSLYSEAPIPCQVWRRENLVELYHNTIPLADTSASDDTFTRFSRPSNSQEDPQREIYVQREKDHEKLEQDNNNNDDDNDDDDDDDGYHISEDSADEMINENMTQSDREPIPNDERLQRALGLHLREHNSVYSSGNADNTNVSTDCQDNISKTTKNFLLPTVSSNLKRVDRNFFQAFNFHSIPFVAGTSTSPSHNLGLNIQQVLSIIKMRQPEVGNNIPQILNQIKQNQASDAIQRQYSHISQKTINLDMNLSSKCSHISHRTMNPNTDLPDIPEKDDSNKIIEECNEPCDGICPTTNSITTIPSCHKENFDSNKSQINQGSCTLEQRNSESKDTKSNFNNCFPTQRCVNYQKILNNYLENGEKLSFLKPSQLPCKLKNQSLRSRFSTVSNIPQTQTDNIVNDETTVADKKDPDFFVHLQGKEKIFKDILINLNEDIKRLNSKYEELQAGVTQESMDEIEVLTELDAIEAELLGKEEEITVVMALHKEVVSLKEQVKSLKEHPNLANFKRQPTTRLKQRYILPREPTTAVRLTKLLRTIQQFQEKLRLN